jgi:hypothetical protein
VYTSWRMASSNPFQGTDAPTRDPVLGITNDGWLTIALAMLVVPAGICALLAVVTGGVGVVGLFVDVPMEPGDPPLAVIGLLECAFMLIPTALYGSAAAGVYLRTKWGWMLALIGFGLWMGGCCMPLGLAGFYALLREEGRRAFGFELP